MRMTRQFLMTSALVVALSATGCKKDEPAPPPAVADVAAPEKVPTPEPKEPAVALKLVEDKPVEPVAPSGEFVARAPINMKGLAALPEKVLGVGATSSVKALVAALAKFAKGAPADPFAMFLTLAQRGAGLGDLQKIAWDKPLYVVFPSPATWKDGFVWVASVAEDFDVKATFPTATEADGGFKVELGPQNLFVRVVGGTVQIASHADLFVELNDFLTKDLLAWTPSNLLQMEGSVENALKTYAPEIAEAKAMMPMLMEQMKEQGGNAGQMQMMATYADKALEMAQEISRIGFVLDPTSDFPRMGFSMTFKDGTDGAAFVADSANRRVKLATSIPEEAWLSFAYSYDNLRDPTSIEEIETLLATAYSEYITWKDGEVHAVAELLVKLNALTGDQQAFWLRSVGQRPFAIESVSNTPDAAAWRANVVAALDLLIEKAWSVGKTKMAQEIGPEGAAKFDGDFKSVWKELAGLAQPFGLSLSDRSDESVVGVELKIDWSKFPVEDKPEGAMVKQVVGDTLQFAFGAKGGYAAMAFGPTAYTRIEALYGQEEVKSTDKWLNRAAERSWAVISLNPGPLLNVISGWPMLADAAEALRSIPSLPVTVEGIANGEMLQFELELPLALVHAIAGVFEAR